PREPEALLRPLVVPYRGQIDAVEHVASPRPEVRRSDRVAFGAFEAHLERRQPGDDRREQMPAHASPSIEAHHLSWAPTEATDRVVGVKLKRRGRERIPVAVPRRGAPVRGAPRLELRDERAPVLPFTLELDHLVEAQIPDAEAADRRE